MTAQFPGEQDAERAFERQEDAFRDFVSTDPSAPFPAVADRYHLYICLACPWASRSLIVRNLKGLANTVGVTAVDPIRDERGWAFRDGPGHSRDPINGFAFLSEAYFATDPAYDAERVTVPVLWDKKTRRIINNSEDDICRMFNGVFNAFGNREVDLFPHEIEEEHAKLSAFIYDNVNNGVYKASFATRQQAYEKACRAVFAALDELEARLATQRFLIGKRIVEADWRLFLRSVDRKPWLEAMGSSHRLEMNHS